jgi:serine/threonine protein kinase
MTPERRERVSELFAAALDIDSNYRDAFLKGACDDAEVRAEVISLLAEHEQIGTFLETPLLGSILPAPGGGESKPPVISESILLKLSDRYENISQIGHGGMGIVYRACDRVTGEMVALKVLRPDTSADLAAMERFKNEMRLARRITHKNVCRIHEFHLVDDSAYISMEFVEGESLRQILQRFGGLPLRKGIQMASQICAGLREAHSRGIVHRDLKPENIMIDPAGNAKIMDFGIARSVDTGITQGAVVIGTAAYMSPEQATGKAVDARSDIYSLGLVLYEVLTDRSAFAGNSALAVAMKQISESPIPPREIEPTIPVQTEEII